jgi:hypothetical protein
MDVTLDISVITDHIEDFANQRELLQIQAELAGHGAELIPLRTPVSDATPKSSNIDLLIGSVHLVLPASVLITTITVFVQQYFKTKRDRGLRLTRGDGSSLEIRGYDGDETAKLIKGFIVGTAHASDTRLLE